ncbi:hypothetical protein ACHAXA_000911 [Cyclostephanos tholiformis]|uniref:Uncharacterized protein n=1 Tax=Cyclostephanos tholiformis TaxID=382380 RepID=A0ABD3RX92_9STRA
MCRNRRLLASAAGVSVMHRLGWTAAEVEGDFGCGSSGWRWSGEDDEGGQRGGVT